MKEVQQCRKCLMDTLDDPELQFDDNGICSYCQHYENSGKVVMDEGEKGSEKLARLIDRVRVSGKGKSYDCIIGLSGGVDSSYLAFKVQEWGLRPLAVHFDNGWNSELAVKNIEQIVSRLNIDLYTLVVDWEEFRNLQLAFINASVVDIEMLTDHAIVAALYKQALKNKIKYILNGSNHVTEAILPKHWIHHKADHVHIRSLQKMFNGKPLKTFPLFDQTVRTRAFLAGIEMEAPLNWIPYRKQEAKNELVEKLGWRDYGGKHFESIFTRFYQGYILPRKFGIDKRKAHLSTLICSGQMSRDEALREIAKPIYDAELLKSDYSFVVKKLGLSPAQFEEYLRQPPKPHSAYPVETEIYNRVPLLKIARPFWQLAKRKLRAS